MLNKSFLTKKILETKKFLNLSNNNTHCTGVSFFTLSTKQYAEIHYNSHNQRLVCKEISQFLYAENKEGLLFYKKKFIFDDLTINVEKIQCLIDPHVQIKISSTKSRSDFNLFIVDLVDFLGRKKK